MGNSWLITATTATALIAATESIVAADTYDDVKGIITQLIEDNISTEVIPNAARQVPVLCEYFPGTIDSIKEKRYTGLKTVLRKEVADAAGEQVYSYLTQKVILPTPGTTKQSETSKTLTAFSLAQEQLSTSSAAAFNAIVADPAAPAQTPTACSGATESTATKAMRTCAQPQGKGTQIETACAAAILVRDAVEGSEQNLHDDTERVVTALIDEYSVASAAAGNGWPTTQHLQSLKAALQTAQARLVGLHDMKLEAALELIIGAVATCAESNEPNATCTKIALFVEQQSAAVAPIFSAIHEHFSDIVQIVSLLRDKNYGAAVKIMLETAVTLKFHCDEEKDKNNRACTAQGKAVLKFVENLAVITIDAAASGHVADDAEANFRNSAIDVIKEAGGGLGYTRYAISKRAILYPQFTLRDAWRPGAAIIGGETTQRYASVDLLAFRGRLQYTNYLYVALQGSVIDALGPFSEVALRGHLLDDSSYKGLVFIEGFAALRGEVEFGSPALSRNLVVGAGVTGRLYRAHNDGSGTYHYCVVFDSCAQDKNITSPTWDNLEVGVFVRYIP